MATRRTPSPSKKKPSHLLELFEEGVGIVLASLVMIVAAPVFVHAFTGDTVQAQATSDLSSVSSMLSDLKSQIATVDGKVDALTARVVAQGGANDASVAASGVATCLSTCRATEAACLKTAFSKPIAPMLSTSGTISIVNTQDTACAKAADVCALSCKPQPTVTPSCQARCAMDLGACIRAAGDDTVAAQRCRSRNTICLAALCIPPSAGSLIVRTSRVPASSCVTQCATEAQICQQNSSIDQSDCDVTTKVCLNVVCAGAPVPIGTVLLQTCENACTAKFESCTKSTKDEAATTSCNNRYGSCRDTCRKVAGGTNESFGQGTPSTSTDRKQVVPTK